MIEKSLQNKIKSEAMRLGFSDLGNDIKLRDLSDNFKKLFENLNREALDGKSLSEVEFARLTNKFPAKSVDAYRVLQEGVLITLDDNRDVRLKFVDWNDHSQNTFQVATEVTVPALTTRRLDMILLINGIPLTDIEFKKEGVDVQEAINQMYSYSQVGVYKTGLMKFVQFLVATNNVTSKYLANNDGLSADDLRASDISVFSHRDHTDYTSFVNVLKDLLIPEKLLKLVKNFIVPVGDRLLILRPYQMQAVEEGIQAVKDGSSGYFWHATGSGKTLTAFKLAETTVRELNKKVIFIVDRDDLSSQTGSEFEKFARPQSKGDYDVLKGKRLVKAVNDKDRGIVITTTQSLSQHIEEFSYNGDLVIIVDECHRSTFGKMLKDIRKKFPKAVLLGFTGTPVFKKEDESSFTTSEIFRKCLDTYNLYNAIMDEKVLSWKKFVIDISPTIPDSTDSDGTVATEKPSEAFHAPSKTLSAGSLDSDYYRSDARLQGVAKVISENLYKHTEQRDKKKTDRTTGYNAMLATDGKEAAFTMWGLLCSELAKQGRFATMIISVEHTSLGETEGMVKVFQDYDKHFGTAFAKTAKGDFVGARKAFLAHLTKNMKNGNIDLLIVSDMLLTGFDVPCLNTIYFDKNTNDRNLIQAISRTNRKNGAGKTHGNIVLFSDRNQDEQLDRALSTYSNEGALDGIVSAKPYEEALKELKEAVRDLLTYNLDKDYILNLQDSAKALALSRAFFKVLRTLKNLTPYIEWDEKELDTLGITYEKIDEVRSALVRLKEKLSGGETGEGTGSVDLNDLKLTIQLITGETVIDRTYLYALLQNATFTPSDERDKWLEKVRKVLEDLETNGQIKDHQIILDALDAVEAGKVKNQQELDDFLLAQRQQSFENNIAHIAGTFGVEQGLVRSWVQYYLDRLDENGISDDAGLRSLIMERLSGSYKEKRQRRDGIIQNIKKLF